MRVEAVQCRSGQAQGDAAGRFAIGQIPDSAHTECPLRSLSDPRRTAMRKGFLAPASRSAQRFAPITPESLLPEDNVLERSDSVSPSDPGRTDPSAETDIGTSSAQYTETTVAAQLPAVSRQSSSAALSSCLDLLKGPSDERRCVLPIRSIGHSTLTRAGYCVFTIRLFLSRLAGLVIATTRLVGNVGVEELRQIYEAVGFTFVSRLLLPLARSQVRGLISVGDRAGPTSFVC